MTKILRKWKLQIRANIKFNNFLIQAQEVLNIAVFTIFRHAILEGEV